MDGDMIAFSANGTGGSECVDLHSDPAVSYVNQQPLRDLQQDITCTIEENSGNVTFIVSRQLDTGDIQDFLVPIDEQFEIGWAVNTAKSDLAWKHDLHSGS